MLKKAHAIPLVCIREDIQERISAIEEFKSSREEQHSRFRLVIRRVFAAEDARRSVNRPTRELEVGVEVVCGRAGHKLSAQRILRSDLQDM